MELRELVGIKDMWSKRAIGTTGVLGVCFLFVVLVHYMKVDPSSELYFAIITLFMIVSAGVLLLLLWYSLLKVQEVFQEMVWNYRILSEIVENTPNMMPNLFVFDLKGGRVLDIFRRHERYDLIELYGLDLERILDKPHNNFPSVTKSLFLL